MRTDSGKPIDPVARFLKGFADLRGRRILLALSGGADSVALLHALIKLRERFGFELAAAHLTLVPELKAELAKQGRDEIMIVVGCVVPPQDYDALMQAGCEAIFPPGTVIAEAAEKLLKTLNKRLGHGKEAAE